MQPVSKLVLLFVLVDLVDTPVMISQLFRVVDAAWRSSGFVEVEEEARGRVRLRGRE